MTLEDVMREVAAVLSDITGLRVHDNPPGTVQPPAGYVSYPLEVDLATEYGHETARYRRMPITLLAGKVTGRAARDKASAWLASAGPESVKALTEAHVWTSCDDLTITGATFDIETIGAVDYLAVIFTADVGG